MKALRGVQHQAHGTEVSGMPHHHCNPAVPWQWVGFAGPAIPRSLWAALGCPQMPELVRSPCSESCCVWQGCPRSSSEGEYRYHKLCPELERCNGVERRQALFTHRYLCSQQC